MSGCYRHAWMISLLMGVSLIASRGLGSVDTEKEMLKRSTDSGWYDAETDRVKAGKDALQQSDVEDRYRSVKQSATPINNNWLTSFFSAIGQIISSVTSSWFIVLMIFIAILLLVGTWVVVDLMRNNGEFRGTGRSWGRGSGDTASVKDLPFEIDQPIAGLLDAARRCRESGDYSRAIIYLFSHVLIELDSARCIRLERGKTNRIYLKELRPRPPLHDYSQQVVDEFERSFFGKHMLSRERFEPLWDQLTEFEQALSVVRMGDNVPAGLPPHNAVPLVQS